jgi:hypothetical protein
VGRRAGCRDDPHRGAPDISADEAPYVDALTTAFTQSPALPFDAADARCVSAIVIDAIGLDRLEAASVTPEVLAVATGIEGLGVDLDDDDAEAVATAFADCDISLADAVIAGSGQRGVPLPDEAADCVRDELDEDDFAHVYARSMLDEDPEPSSEFDAFFLELADACPQLDPLAGT